VAGADDLALVDGRAVEAAAHRAVGMIVDQPGLCGLGTGELGDGVADDGVATGFVTVVLGGRGLLAIIGALGGTGGEEDSGEGGQGGQTADSAAWGWWMHEQPNARPTPQRCHFL
jgi:hypothetical protein